MNILDCFSIVIQFFDINKDRISLLRTSRKINDICSNSPIYYQVKIEGRDNIPDKYKLNQLRNIKFRYVTNLPNLPLVETLECCYNRLTILPSLPNVKILDCSSNILTSLPDLPNIKVLICYENKLTSLPNLLSINLL